jgi:hypothetical protein
MSGLAEHNFRARGPTAGRVRGEILRTHVGFRLDDTTHANNPTIIMHKVHADEITSYIERAWGVEAAGKFAAGSTHGAAWYQCALARGGRELPRGECAKQPPGVGLTWSSTNWSARCERRF